MKSSIKRTPMPTSTNLDSQTLDSQRGTCYAKCSVVLPHRPAEIETAIMQRRLNRTFTTAIIARLPKKKKTYASECPARTPQQSAASFTPEMICNYEIFLAFFLRFWFCFFLSLISFVLFTPIIERWFGSETKSWMGYGVQYLLFLSLACMDTHFS